MTPCQIANNLHLPRRNKVTLSTALSRVRCIQLESFWACIPAIKLFTIMTSSNRRASRAGVPRAKFSGRQTDVTESISASIQPQPRNNHVSNNSADNGGGSRMWDSRNLRDKLVKLTREI